MSTKLPQPISASIQAVDAHDADALLGAFTAGAFEGSPIQLRFHFTLSGGKIAAPVIRR